VTTISPSLPVVVGIDGSDAAITAALWAVDEAVDRGVPLRLVHVIPAADSENSFGLETDQARTALRAADAAVRATDMPVKVETAVVCGGNRVELLHESRKAAMMCVGSVGAGQVDELPLGSTAATLANTAYCPVAIIRPHSQTAPANPGWMVVAVDNPIDSQAVVECGFAEAALRAAPLMALGPGPQSDRTYCDRPDHRLDVWRDRYCDVSMHTVAAPDGVAEFVAGSQQPIQLAIIGRTDAGQILRLVDPGGPSIFDHAECSILVVRN
jgi:nucleotide-binding universal stress UspA family protein